MTEVRATKNQHMTALITESVGRNLWDLVLLLAWLAENGTMIVVPARFRTDKFTKPGSNSFGQRDRAAVIHDFLVRCRKLLGMTMMDCHNYFLEAMVYCDECDLPTKSWKRNCALVWRRVSRNVYYGAVVSFNWIICGDGYGITGDPRYDCPVGDDLAPLDVWVREHYSPDGTGYNDGDFVMSPHGVKK